VQNSPDRLRRRHSLRIANIDASLATGFGTLLGGTFIIGFIKSAIPPARSDYWIGLFSALPSLWGIFLIPGAVIARQFPTYKPYQRLCGIVWRAMHMPWIIMPFLIGIAAEVRFTIMLTCSSIGNIFSNLGGATYNDWLSTLAEPSSRGFYFTRRTAILTLAGSVVAVGGAVLLDQFHRLQDDALGFGLTFGIAGVLAWVSFFYFDKMLDIARDTVVKANLREAVVQTARPARDRAFQPVLVFAFISIFGQSFASSFYSAFALESLKMPYTLINIFALVQGFTQLLTSGFWGRLMDRFGTRPIAILSGIGIISAPALWLAAIPGNQVFNATLIIVASIWSGFVWSGALPANLNILIVTAPEQDRGPYLGAGATVQAIAGAIAPLASAMMLTSLRVPLGAVGAYKGIIAVGMGLRLIAVFFLVPVREPGATSLRATVRSLWRSVSGQES